MELDTLTILIELFGGLALFLFGMDQMTEALKAVAGDGMRRMLGRFTANRFTAMLSGTAVTAVIQSSSVTTVLVIGFITAGLMTVEQSLGVIVGAKIGTTVTAQIIAFKVTKVALVLVSVGFLAHFASKRAIVRRYGAMVMGLGLIFFGMNVMSDATRPLRTFQPFIDFLAGMEDPMFAMLLSAAFTAVVQSSSASIGVVIVLATQGFISLETGIALCFGANLGTCVTAALAAIGKPRAAVRAAVFHIGFALVSVFVWLPFIEQLAEVVRAISPVATEAAVHQQLSAAQLDGARAVDSAWARRAIEIPRQVANAHTLFNVLNAVLVVGFLPLVARALIWAVPDRPEPESARGQPRYLDRTLLATPALALDAAHREIVRMAEITGELIRACPGALQRGTRDQIDALAEGEADIDQLQRAVLAYLRSLAQGRLRPRDSERIGRLLTVMASVEHISDAIEANLVHLGHDRIERQLSISPDTNQRLDALAARVAESYEGMVKALRNDDVRAAKKSRKFKKAINEAADALDHHLSARLMTDDPNRLSTYRFERDLVEGYKRLHLLTRRVARDITEHRAHGEQWGVGDEEAPTVRIEPV